MRLSTILPALLLLALTGDAAEQSPRTQRRPVGTRLESGSWQAAEAALRADAIVVLPIGGGAVEHGLHMPLDTDRRIAEYLSDRILADTDVVVAPTLSYHHYPAFVEYPGSTTLSLAVARDVTADVVRSVARSGPRRFYALTAAGTTLPALAEAAKLVARDGVLLRYTDARAKLETTIRALQRQPFGSHADEIETSMLLFIDPARVDMAMATRELGNESSPLHLTRRQGGRGTFSASGAWGDPTAATPEKGGKLLDALLRAIRSDLDDLRRSALPAGGATPTSSGAASDVPAAPRATRPGECLAGDDRTIRGIGPAFSSAWLHQDAIALSGFWNTDGDMVHPDGYVEGSSQTIRENRTALFMRPEYRSSRHGLFIGQVRCITGDVAVADAKWDLRGVTDANGGALPPVEGLSTLVLKRRGGGWGIEAYRYTITQNQNSRLPTVLNRPGFTQPIR